MQRAAILGKVIVLVWTILLCGIPKPASAGETSAYLKSGWFSWEERVNGSSFVKERGAMHGAGVARKDEVAAIAIAELLEVWGGALDYDGHDVTGAQVIKSDTVYLGTREEVAFSKPLPAGALQLEPLVAIGHKFWARSRSSEDWNTFYAKAGAGAQWRKGDWKLFVKGGGLVPFYTRTHASLSDAGYSDVVTEPKPRLSAFAEGGARVGAFTISVDYEGMEFGRSDKVPTRKSSGTNGVQISGGEAYQPDSSATLVSLKLTFSF
jgi:hypothetical protein